VGGATEAAEQQSSGEAGQQASRPAGQQQRTLSVLLQCSSGTVGLCHTATVEYEVGIILCSLLPPGISGFWMFAGP
jgi:hypothetical protein